MPRVKLIPDTEIFAQVRLLMRQSGERGASFGAVSRASHLAAATLVQRYGSQDGMVRAALADGWDQMARAVDAAEGKADLSPKGAQVLLREVTEQAGGTLHLLVRHLEDPALRLRAQDWRARLEQALVVRLGGGAKAQEAAALLFAAWQGQMVWQISGEKGFKLKDAVKRLT